MLRQSWSKVFTFRSTRSPLRVSDVGVLRGDTSVQLSKYPRQETEEQAPSSAARRRLGDTPALKEILPQTSRGFSSTCSEVGANESRRKLGEHVSCKDRSTFLTVSEKVVSIPDSKETSLANLSTPDFLSLSDDSRAELRFAPSNLVGRELSGECSPRSVRPHAHRLRLKHLFRECLGGNVDSLRSSAGGRGEVRKALRSLRVLRNIAHQQKRMDEQIEAYASLPVLTLESSSSSASSEKASEESCDSLSSSLEVLRPAASAELNDLLFRDLKRLRFELLPFEITTKLFRASAEAAEALSRRTGSTLEDVVGGSGSVELLRFLQGLGRAVLKGLTSGEAEIPSLLSVLKGLAAWRIALRRCGISSERDRFFKELLFLQRQTLRTSRQTLWQIVSFSDASRVAWTLVETQSFHSNMAAALISFLKMRLSEARTRTFSSWYDVRMEGPALSLSLREAASLSTALLRVGKLNAQLLKALWKGATLTAKMAHHEQTNEAEAEADLLLNSRDVRAMLARAASPEVSVDVRRLAIAGTAVQLSDATFWGSLFRLTRRLAAQCPPSKLTALLSALPNQREVLEAVRAAEAEERAHFERIDAQFSKEAFSSELGIEARANAAFSRRAPRCSDFGEVFYAATRSLAWCTDTQCDARTLIQLLNIGAVGVAASSSSPSAFVMDSALLDFLALSLTRLLEKGELARASESVAEAQHLAVAWRAVNVLTRETSEARRFCTAALFPTLSEEAAEALLFQRKAFLQREEKELMKEELLPSDLQSASALYGDWREYLAEAFAAASALSSDPAERVFFEEAAAHASGADSKEVPVVLASLESSEEALAALRSALENNLLRLQKELKSKSFQRSSSQRPALAAAWSSIALWASSAFATSRTVLFALEESAFHFKASTRLIEKEAGKAGTLIAAASRQDRGGLLSAGCLMEVAQLATSLQCLANCLRRGVKPALHALLPAVRSLIHACGNHYNKVEERERQSPPTRTKGGVGSVSRDIDFAWECMADVFLSLVELDAFEVLGDGTASCLRNLLHCQVQRDALSDNALMLCLQSQLIERARQPETSDLRNSPADDGDRLFLNSLLEAVQSRMARGFLSGLRESLLILAVLQLINFDAADTTLLRRRLAWRAIALREEAKRATSCKKRAFAHPVSGTGWNPLFPAFSFSNAGSSSGLQIGLHAIHWSERWAFRFCAKFLAEETVACMADDASKGLHESWRVFLTSRKTFWMDDGKEDSLSFKSLRPALENPPPVLLKEDGRSVLSEERPSSSN